MLKEQFCNVPSVLYQNRFCSQEHFDIIASTALYHSSTGTSKHLVKFHYPNLNRIDPIQVYENSVYSSVVISSDVYTTCRKDDSKEIKYIGDYGENDKYTKQAILPETEALQFACSFMKYIFVFTRSRRIVSRNYCLMYNIKSKQWTYIADTNSYRCFAACTIFEGQIVVSGGLSIKTVEAYDYHEDTWTYSPNMNEKRECHGAVSMGNKMFVIGGDMNLTCEVFDSISKKFTYIKELSVVRFSDLDSVKAITVGSKIIVFAGIDSTYCEVDVYDPL